VQKKRLDILGRTILGVVWFSISTASRTRATIIPLTACGMLYHLSVTSVCLRKGPSRLNPSEFAAFVLPQDVTLSEHWKVYPTLDLHLFIFPLLV